MAPKFRNPKLSCTSIVKSGPNDPIPKPKMAAEIHTSGPDPGFIIKTMPMMVMEKLTIKASRFVIFSPKAPNATLLIIPKAASKLTAPDATLRETPVWVKLFIRCGSKTTKASEPIGMSTDCRSGQQEV